MKKDNKTITVTKKRMTVNYHDSAKHFTYVVKKGDPNRDIKLFGKEFKGTKAMEAKDDFLSPRYREMFNDLIYAKKRMTHSEIQALPIARRYTIQVLSKEVERVLNRWKSEVVSKKVDSLLLKIFPNSPIIQQMTSVCATEKDGIYDDSISIHSIFTERQIAEYLSEKGLFPKFK